MLKKINKIIIHSLIFGILLFFNISQALAFNFANDSGIERTATPAGYSSGQTDIYSILEKVINGLLSLLGIVFLGLMLYGGFNWMTARGNEQEVDKARDTITAAIIGVIIIAAAYGITTFVFAKLSGV